MQNAMKPNEMQIRMTKESLTEQHALYVLLASHERRLPRRRSKPALNRDERRRQARERCRCVALQGRQDQRRGVAP